MQRRLAEVQADSKKHYSERVNKDNYMLASEEDKLAKFKIADDEPRFQPKMWASAMRDSAYYFDRPTLEQEIKMKKTLQSKYDDLFQEGWMPPMQSRVDLVSWVCMQQNKFMQEHDASDKQWNCENPKALIEQFGPNYDSVKAKLGYIKGLHRE
jgi:hypothetical protein